MRIWIAGVVSLATLVGCGAGSSGSSDAGPFIAGFDPPAAAAGYTRYITPPIDGIVAGENQIWCQWLAPPATEDQDVINVTGMQSKYGHHVALYASSEDEPVGTTRVCTTVDMETIRFIGAIGAEGSAGIFNNFPPNTVLRLPKGWGIMANVHFLNVGDTTIDGQAVMDVEYSNPSPDHIVAGFFNNTSDAFTMPPNATFSLDSTCTVQQDLTFFMFANHMHELGTSVQTQILRVDAGGDQLVVQDQPWQAEYEFNPEWKVFPPDQLFVVHAGDTIDTTCNWDNTTSSNVTFPTEMCVGLGFFLPVDGGEFFPEIDCVDGQWPGN